MPLQILKQEEVLYNVNFKIVMMERKIERASGLRSQSETKELNETIDKLTQDLDRVNVNHAMLITQLKKAENHLIQARRQNNNQIQQQGPSTIINQLNCEV